MNRNTVKFSFLSSLPVMAGYVTLGMGFGIILADKGYSFWWALLMSLTIYAGSMQYVGVGLLSSGATVLSTALMTLMVNARHLFYGISMLEKYKNTGAAKPYLIFSLTDETYSLVCNPKLPKDVNQNGYYLLVSVLNQIYWLFGSMLGGILGNVLDFNTAGIDFAMTALFVVIFVEQWETTKNHIPAFIGIMVSVVCLVIFGRESFLIPSMIGITAALCLLKKPILKNNRAEEDEDYDD